MVGRHFAGPTLGYAKVVVLRSLVDLSIDCHWRAALPLALRISPRHSRLPTAVERKFRVATLRFNLARTRTGSEKVGETGIFENSGPVDGPLEPTLDGRLMG